MANTIILKIKNLFFQAQQRSKKAITAHPFISFLGMMGIFLLLIVVGNYLRKPVVAEQKEKAVPRQVSTLVLGEKPELRVAAHIEKTGVITLVAQTNGVVQSIKTDEGKHVKRGQVLLYLSTNYQGGNVSTMARKISQKNYQFVVDTYDAQKSLIAKNRDMANQLESQATELREIARKSTDDTKGLIKLNEEIVNGLDAQIKDLEATNIGGVNDDAILQIKAVKAQTLAALNGLRIGLRSTEYTSSDDQEPAQLVRSSRDIALQQLDIQEKSLDLNRDLAKLSLKIAQITESLSYPGSPCSGTVERINVRIGQVVNPGTVLATITADKTASSLVALVPSELVASLSRIDASTVYLSTGSITLVPQHIASEPTDAGLHAVTYTVPDEVVHRLPDQTIVEVGIPISYGQIEVGGAFLPLDALHFTQEKTFVYVVKTDGEAKVASSRIVKVGEVIGAFAKIRSGLEKNDRIILDRSIIEGDAVAL